MSNQDYLRYKLKQLAKPKRDISELIELQRRLIKKKKKKKKRVKQ